MKHPPHEYTEEKLWQAVSALVGSEDMFSRIANAAMFLVRLDTDRDFVVVDEEDEDATDLRDRFTSIWERLTAVKAIGSEGHIAASVRAMSTEDADKVSDDIVSLLMAVQSVRREAAYSA